jgi:hypothetical protein
MQHETALLVQTAIAAQARALAVANASLSHRRSLSQVLRLPACCKADVSLFFLCKTVRYRHARVGMLCLQSFKPGRLKCTVHGRSSKLSVTQREVHPLREVPHTQRHLPPAATLLAAASAKV